MHVTLRVRAGLPSLRSPRLFPVVRDALADAQRGTFRVVHFSAQADHLHLLVEADDKRSLSSGLRGLVIRCARRINRTLGREGPLWGDRYHEHTLQSPREVRSALVYVLHNLHKHHPSLRQVDRCSSAPWFEGYRDRPPLPADEACPVRGARSWLLRVGWRRHGLIASTEAPRVQRRGLAGDDGR